ncbi:hypothetical protein SEA_SOYO_88 [Mycobacterium phage SoYo]|uniref:Uncharacterized protein n=28 Tax=Microwolfvirus TaxID=2942894 RepID=A0A0A7RW28_9CAUD|nr:hypothetical protein PBI_BXZ2_86 [Mycobacterium phage Bxz2]YP_009195188.1 hypothetical protein AVT20_gp09 [Mycobacterium phage Tiffany]YP_009198516.1 hypothetical protein AVV34_gp09 [Mycobacterium phage MarQuardt]YP_009219155.1 hypothetical protein AVV42_gp09 [Mycobacterium phage Anubis]YP_009635676.1 hypothetical protein FGG58_gp09 [Mycobacterium phage JHC117]AGK87285.1 hypothetical protein PBI_METHUSELAH_84 [Mycobacterium phage Methuselah]AIM51225.1 hypothetical protein PBI_FARBER_85 [My
MIYGDHKVISVNARGDVLRVLVEDMETGEREYRVIPMA